MVARVYTLANQKGGVGKTTSTLNLGAYLAEHGRRVLVVDADAQANLTSSLGFDKREDRVSMYEALVDGASPLEAILPTAHERLELLPSSPSLAGAEVEVVERPNRERLLASALARVQERYDIVLVDSPPSLGILTVNALTAASDGVIIPIQCEYLALEGLSQLMQTLRLVRERLNPQLRILGLLMTMFDSRTNLSQQVVDEVREHYPNLIFRTIIPRSVRLSEAPSYGQSIVRYAPRSPGSLAYDALAQEFLARSGT
jgi:chromosome partitioning protein